MRILIDAVQVVLAYVLYAIGFLINLAATLTGSSTWDSAANTLKYREQARAEKVPVSPSRFNS